METSEESSTGDIPEKTGGLLTGEGSIVNE